MGRGASDLTASALAQALQADACEIYTDVTGVFTADPRIVPQARKLQKVHFDEMLEMAGAGSKVLALRSVEFARTHDVPLHVRSRSLGNPGTWVTNEEASMEDPIISGVVTDMSEAKVTVFGVPDRPGISAALFEPLAAANVNVDMIVQNTSIAGTTDISFTMPMADMNEAEAIVSRVAAEVGANGVSHDNDIAKVSIVGAGMKSSPGHRRQDVPGPRRRGREHPHDLHVDDPRLGRDRGRRHGTRRACPPHRLRPRLRRRLLRPLPTQVGSASSVRWCRHRCTTSDGGDDPVVMGVDAVEGLDLGAVAGDLALRVPPHLDVGQLRVERSDDLIGMQPIRLPTRAGPAVRRCDSHVPMPGMLNDARATAPSGSRNTSDPLRAR